MQKPLGKRQSSTALGQRSNVVKPMENEGFRVPVSRILVLWAAPGAATRGPRDTLWEDQRSLSTTCEQWEMKSEKRKVKSDRREVKDNCRYHEGKLVESVK